MTLALPLAMRDEAMRPLLPAPQQPAGNVTLHRVAASEPLPLHCAKCGVIYTAGTEHVCKPRGADQHRGEAIAALVRDADLHPVEAEQVYDADKVILDGNWFVHLSDGQMAGGPVNADGTFDWGAMTTVDMPELFDSDYAWKLKAADKALDAMADARAAQQREKVREQQQASEQQQAPAAFEQDKVYRTKGCDTVALRETIPESKYRHHLPDDKLQQARNRTIVQGMQPLTGRPAGWYFLDDGRYVMGWVAGERENEADLLPGAVTIGN